MPINGIPGVPQKRRGARNHQDSARLATRISCNTFSTSVDQYHVGHECVTYTDNDEGWLYLSAVPNMYSSIVVAGQ